MHKPTLAVLGAVAIASMTISAVPQPAGRGATSASEAIRQSWSSAKKNILQSADVMPEANYSFKPVESARSFGQIFGHINEHYGNLVTYFRLIGIVPPSSR